MNEPIARLAPYVVLHSEDFDKYLEMLLHCIRAPRDTDWRQQSTEVRTAIERTNPNLLARLFASGNQQDSAFFKFVFSILALHTGYAMSPKLRDYLQKGLQQSRDDCFYPPISSRTAKAEIDKLCNVLRQPHSTPVVEILLDPPALPPLETGD